MSPTPRLALVLVALAPPVRAPVRPRGRRREGDARRRGRHARRSRSTSRRTAFACGSTSSAASRSSPTSSPRRARRRSSTRSATSDHYLRDAKALGAKITHVLLTHTNADFVAGHTELAQAGATIHIAKESGSKFAHDGARGRLDGPARRRDDRGVGDAGAHVRLDDVPRCTSRARRSDPRLHPHGRHALHRRHRPPRPDGRRRDAGPPRLRGLRLDRAAEDAARRDAGAARPRRGVAVRRAPLARDRLDDRARAAHQPLSRAHEPRAVRLARGLGAARRAGVLPVQRAAQPATARP